jgi:hypothetical protein
MSKTKCTTMRKVAGRVRRKGSQHIATLCQVCTADAPGACPHGRCFMKYLKHGSIQNPISAHALQAIVER